MKKALLAGAAALAGAALWLGSQEAATLPQPPSAPARHSTLPPRAPRKTERKALVVPKPEASRPGAVPSEQAWNTG